MIFSFSLLLKNSNTISQSQQDISELKISLQRQEGQAKCAVEDMERKDVELKQTLARKEEAEREMNKALNQLEMLEGRQVYKVITI